MLVGLLVLVIFVRNRRKKQRKTNQRVSRIDERVQANEGEHLCADSDKQKSDIGVRGKSFTGVFLELSAIRTGPLRISRVVLPKSEYRFQKAQSLERTVSGGCALPLGKGGRTAGAASAPGATVRQLRETHQQLTQRLFEHAAPTFWDAVHDWEHDFPQRIQRTL
ncbi:hypothetical protein FRC0095_02058 [Corynebacterium diphtheriae]|nr:hypothetical protein FRC0095_02058 [Corynebacterium diphtheriae]